MSSKANALQRYTWEGRNKRGIKVNGEMVAVSPAIIQAELKRQNIDPLKIRKKSKSLFSNEKKITTLDIVIFTRHLATLITAGMPLVQSLDIIGKGNEKQKFQTLIIGVKNDVASGKNFADSLQKHPEQFNRLFCSLVRSAELSGTLDTMLVRIADYLEKSESLKKKVKKALTYPGAIIAISLIVSSILLVFIVPQFETLFSSFGAELPAFTRLVLNLSESLQNYWWLYAIVLIGGSYGFIITRKRSQKFRAMVDRFILKLSVFGKLLEKSIVARVTRTLSTNLAAGIPLIDALDSVADIANNSVYRNALIQIREDVKTGQTMHTAMLTTHLFPHMVIQMVAVGEESGSLESMLDKIACFYEEDVDNMVSNLSSLLEPLIMVILGVLVGGFVLAMYLPIFQLGSIF